MEETEKEQAQLTATDSKGKPGKIRTKLLRREKGQESHCCNTEFCFSKVWNCVQWSDVDSRPGELGAAAEARLNKEKVAYGEPASCDILGIGLLWLSNYSCLLLCPLGLPWNLGPNFTSCKCESCHTATVCLLTEATGGTLLTFPNTYTPPNSRLHLARPVYYIPSQESHPLI